MDKWTSGPGYDGWMGRWSQLLAEEFLTWIDIPSGFRWLDVCCGTGILTQAMAKRCAPLSVRGIDASSTQIAFAQEHRASAANVSFEVGDAMALPFAPGSFDVAACGLGLNFIPEPARALREFQRVLRPSGTIAAYVWDYQQGARFVREFWDAALQFDPRALEFDQGRRFPVCTRDGLQQLFESAKLAKIEVRALDIETRFANFDDYWQPFLTAQGSAPHYLETCSPSVCAAIRERLKESLPSDATGAISLPARAWAIRAQCP